MINLNLKQQAQFFQQLGAMLNAGLSVQHSLTIVTQNTPPPFKIYLQKVHEAMSNGTDFASALTLPQKPYLDGWTISLIRLAEYSGALGDLCQKLAVNLTNQQRHQRLYISITLAAIATVWGILVFMAAILQQQSVLTFDFWLKALFLGLILMILAFQFGNYFIGYFKSVKIIDTILQATIMLNFSTLALPLSCGIPILSAIDLLRVRFPDVLMKKTLNHVAQQIRRGKTLSDSLQGKLPPVAMQMIITGEETGYLDSALQNIQQYYEGELERSLNQLQGILRPISIISLGGVTAIAAIRLLTSLMQSLP